MLEHVVRFVVALLVPAAEKSAITGMLRDFAVASPGATPSSSSMNREIRSPLSMLAVSLAAV